MVLIGPFGLQTLRFFKTPDIGVRNADEKGPDLC